GSSIPFLSYYRCPREEQMDAFELARELQHEELVCLRDRDTGLVAFIALHDTTLGPAVGGTRMRVYPTPDAAAVDALRLARAMTAKAAMCGIARGGGKAVILGDPSRDKTEPLLLQYGRAGDRLGGRFHTGPDMGIDGRDVAIMSTVTRYVSHARAGNPLEAADLAALGVEVAIGAAGQVLGRPLDGLTVALQGLGEVGMRLARSLHRQGVRLLVADVDEDKVEEARAALRAEASAPSRLSDRERRA